MSANRVPLPVVIITALLMVVPIVFTGPAPAAAEPTTGSVAAGHTGSWNCLWSANCIVFLDSGCHPAFAQAYNGFSSSIVEVGPAGTGDAGEWRVLRSGAELSTGVGWFGVEFYRSTCEQVASPLPPLTPHGLTVTLTVPEQAKWMVVSASNALEFTWTLSSS